jgi:hypothetical protein
VLCDRHETLPELEIRIENEDPEPGILPPNSLQLIDLFLAGFPELTELNLFVNGAVATNVQEILFDEQKENPRIQELLSILPPK